jgi:hypothetical protein
MTHLAMPKPTSQLLNALAVRPSVATEVDTAVQVNQPYGVTSRTLLERIPELPITVESAAQDRQNIQDLRNKHGVARSDFQPLPRRSA